MKPHQLRIHGLGTHVDVECVGAAADVLAGAMATAWSRCLDKGDDEEAAAAPLQIRLDDEADLAGHLMGATQQITRALITARIGSLLMLHAGAVSHPHTGASLVFVAPGGTGKTTLSRLLGQDYGYLTDETVGITADGEILPYPKPLSVRRLDEAGLKDEMSPDALGLLDAHPRPRVSRLVILDRQPEQFRPVLEELSSMDALFALVGQISSLEALERPLHRLGWLIETSGQVIRVNYSEAAEVASDLRGLLQEAA